MITVSEHKCVGDGFIAEPGMTAMIGAAASGIDAAKDIEDRLKPGSY